MSFSWLSFSEPFDSGIDFNQKDSADVQVLISASVDLVTSLVTKTANAASALAPSADVTVSLHKTTFADVSLSGLSVTATVATERQDALVSVSANATVTVSMMKIAYSESSPSSSASVSQTVIKIAEIASTLSSTANITAESFRILLSSTAISAAVSLTSAATKISQAVLALTSSVQLSVAGKITLATIRIVLEEVGAVVVQTPNVFAQNAVSSINAGVYRTLVLLDGKPLTIHNRKIDMGIDQIFTETANWNNRKTRYYKSNSRAGRRTFSMSWSWLPNSINYTVDGNSGRDFIKKVAEDPRHHVLKIINMDETGTTPYSETSYNVLVKDYNETLIRRDIPNDVYFWDCSMSLEEV